MTDQPKGRGTMQHLHTVIALLSSRKLGDEAMSKLKKETKGCLFDTLKHALLYSDNPKTRRNSAMLMAKDVEANATWRCLLEALQKEPSYLVKSDIAAAMSYVALKLYKAEREAMKEESLAVENVEDETNLPMESPPEIPENEGVERSVNPWTFW